MTTTPPLTPPHSPDRQRHIPVMSNSPPRPQTNPIDAIYVWLRNVRQFAEHGANEDIASLTDLALTVPANTICDAEVQGTIALVLQVATTKKFNPALVSQVECALKQLELYKV